MGDSGRRKERIKIPLIGWEGRDCRKDVRFRGLISDEIPKLEQVKFPGLFLRDGLRTAASGRSPGLHPGKLSAAPAGLIDTGHIYPGRPGLFSASLVPISFFRLCPSTSNHAKVCHRPPLCHPEEPTCLWQVEKEMTLQSPWMRGPEGRPPNVSPARKGWEINVEDDLSAVGAALKSAPAPTCVIRALSSRALAERRGTCCAPFPLTTPYSSVHPSPPMPSCAVQKAICALIWTALIFSRPLRQAQGRPFGTLIGWPTRVARLP
jgi:hypothetical protein